MIDRVTTLPIDHFPNVSWKYVRTGGRYRRRKRACGSRFDSNGLFGVFGVAGIELRSRIFDCIILCFALHTGW